MKCIVSYDLALRGFKVDGESTAEFGGKGELTIDGDLAMIVGKIYPPPHNVLALLGFLFAGFPGAVLVNWLQGRRRAINLQKAECLVLDMQRRRIAVDVPIDGEMQLVGFRMHSEQDFEEAAATLRTLFPDRCYEGRIKRPVGALIVLFPALIVATIAWGYIIWWLLGPGWFVIESFTR